MRYLKAKPIVHVSSWNFGTAWTWSQAKPCWEEQGRDHAPLLKGHLSLSVPVLICALTCFLPDGERLTVSSSLDELQWTHILRRIRRQCLTQVAVPELLAHPPLLLCAGALLGFRVPRYPQRKRDDMISALRGDWKSWWTVTPWGIHSLGLEP